MESKQLLFNRKQLQVSPIMLRCSLRGDSAPQSATPNHRPTGEVEKREKASQGRRQHMQRTGLETRPAVVHRAADILRLEHHESKCSLPKMPFQKLSNKALINRSCILGQPGDPIQVSIILPTQVLDA